MASSRWQSAWWLLPAVAVSIAYFIVLTLVDGTFCFSLAPFGDTLVAQLSDSDDTSSSAGYLSFLPVTARTMAVFRLLQWANVLLACLLLAVLTATRVVLPLIRQRHAAKQASGGVGATGGATSGGVSHSNPPGGCGATLDSRPFVPQAVRAYLRLLAIEAEPQPSVWQALRWLNTRFALVPLRHWLAMAAAAFSLLLLQLSVDNLIGTLADSGDGSDDPLSVLLVVVGASAHAAQVCVSVFGALSMLLSLWFISGDVVVLVEAHSAAWSPPVPAAAEEALLRGAADSFQPESPVLPSETAQPHKQLEAPRQRSQPPPLVHAITATADWLLRFAGGRSGTIEAPLSEPRTLDLSAFQYTDAAGYILMYVTSLLAVCSLLGAAFFGLGVFLTLPALRGYLGTYLATMAFSVLYRLAVTRCLRCCCARGDALLLPRAFMWADAVLSLFVSVLFSVSLGLTRVALSALWALLAASQLSRSTLPAAAATLDAGFQMYGATLKCSFAWAIDPTSVPAPGVVYSD